MKCAILGGGGVRTPLLVQSIVSRMRTLPIDEVALMDTDGEKLRVYGGIAAAYARRSAPRLCVTLTDDAQTALQDADFIITTLRVGQERGRVLDERIALAHGVLGQETTGAGGFAMAMRSIPALLHYCGLAKKIARKDAPICNFTNPSGLVTQALRNAGYQNVYGICDGPSSFFRALEENPCIPHGKMRVDCFGLNHLSFYRSIRVDGKELLADLIKNEELYRTTELRFFPQKLVQSLGMLPNGYLYYYYCREQALHNIQLAGKTRGETISEINRAMLLQLRALDPENDFEQAVAIYLEGLQKREDSYMRAEAGNAGQESVRISLNEKKNNGGYMDVALDFIEATKTKQGKEMVLSVPNNGAIDGLEDDDVVEITCRVSCRGVTPIHIGEMPQPQQTLIKTVKAYERLAVRAILTRDKALAELALTVHPLINSYTLAHRLIDEYTEVHSRFAGVWR
jgi:Alpha-galactosidases/6-phospho-beta-glucosidases, family 4 of glycosyl hydrolases